MFTAFTTTGIGSMPHRDPGRACRVILERVDIPFWPQLPGLSFRESMIPQYSEGMPAVQIDEAGQKIRIDGSDGAAVNAFYESCSEEGALPISGDFARGVEPFLEMIGERSLPVLKGQVTGPLTFTLGLQDQEGRPVFFNEELREISLMVLGGKVRWQIDVLGRHCDRVMIFIDEPILSAIGTSAYMGVAEDEVRRLLAEMVSAIKGAGGISAIHCCGRADWQMVMETGIDVVNFDAFGYFENFLIYPDATRAFLERGGYIAWGIVPTSEAIDGTDPEGLREKVLAQIEELSERIEWPSLEERILLTPACGAGSLSEGQAERVFETLSELRHLLVD